MINNTNPSNETGSWERNWKGVIQNLYDSGFFDGMNGVESDGKKVKITIEMVENLISQAIKERDQQWIKAVGGEEGLLLDISENYGKNDGIMFRNDFRHQIKDKMGLGEDTK